MVVRVATTNQCSASARNRSGTLAFPISINGGATIESTTHLNIDCADASPARR